MSADITTIISSLASSIGITAAGTWWVGRQWVKHKLTKALEAQKADWNKELEKQKAIWQGEVKRSVENELADKAALREYEFAARHRLYTAIGPLRFQLLIACRNLALHINTLGLENVQYSLAPTNYYGKSTLYRLILPLTIAELIERQIYFTDFSVESEAVDLLRFKKAAFRSFNSNKPILNHPRVSWDKQIEHLFHHTVSTIANSLIIHEKESPKRPMHFHEFEEHIQQQDSRQTIAPLSNILMGFEIKKKPIFWIRLVFYAYVSAMLVNKIGVKIGFENINIEPAKLLNLSSDEFTQNKCQQLCEQFESLSEAGL